MRDADIRDVGDPISFHDDVDGSAWRRAGSIDQCRAANDELRERTDAFVAVGGELRILALLVAKIASGRAVWRRRSLLSAGELNRQRGEKQQDDWAADSSHDGTGDERDA
jgi:hypothetical protein